MTHTHACTCEGLALPLKLTLHPAICSAAHDAVGTASVGPHTADAALQSSPTAAANSREPGAPPLGGGQGIAAPEPQSSPLMADVSAALEALSAQLPGGRWGRQTSSTERALSARLSILVPMVVEPPDECVEGQQQPKVRPTPHGGVVAPANPMLSEPLEQPPLQDLSPRLRGSGRGFRRPAALIMRRSSSQDDDDGADWQQQQQGVFTDELGSGMEAAGFAAHAFPHLDHFVVPPSPSMIKSLGTLRARRHARAAAALGTTQQQVEDGGSNGETLLRSLKHSTTLERRGFEATFAPSAQAPVASAEQADAGAGAGGWTGPMALNPAPQNRGSGSGIHSRQTASSVGDRRPAGSSSSSSGVAAHLRAGSHVSTSGGGVRGALRGGRASAADALPSMDLVAITNWARRSIPSSASGGVALMPTAAPAPGARGLPDSGPGFGGRGAAAASAAAALDAPELPATAPATAVSGPVVAAHCFKITSSSGSGAAGGSNQQQGESITYIHYTQLDHAAETPPAVGLELARPQPDEVGGGCAPSGCPATTLVVAIKVGNTEMTCCVAHNAAGTNKQHTLHHHAAVSR